ncbi:MAG: hypothetical protein AAF125_07175 [Chloroflexota bacterium]
MKLINTGKAIRLGRILHPVTQRAAVVAFDHGVHLGAIPGNIHPGEMLHQLADAGADAFLVGPGVARSFSDVFRGPGAPGFILRLDWTNRWRGENMLGSSEGHGRLIASVEDALRMGADAVLMYMFIGYQDPDVEAQQVEDVARITQACERWGMGCIIEPMPRGQRVGHEEYNPEYIQMVTRMACELGADLLKTDYSGDSESFSAVVDASFRPVLIAGGPKTETQRQALEMVRGAIDAGASGMFIGRNVFQSEDPVGMMDVMRRIIHENLSVDSAIDVLEK